MNGEHKNGVVGSKVMFRLERVNFQACGPSIKVKRQVFRVSTMVFFCAPTQDSNSEQNE